MGVIESSYESIDSGQLVPSFFSWLFEGSLNDGSGHIFGIGLILLVAVVSFLSFKGFRWEKALMVSAFITFFVAILSLKAGWISTQVFILACIYVVVGIYYLFDKSSQEEA